MKRARILLLAVFIAFPAFAQTGWGTPAITPEVSAAEQRAQVATESLAAATAELEGFAERQAEAQRSLVTHARAFYRLRRSGMMPVRGGFDAMLSHLSRMERLERMVRRDVRAVRRLDTRDIELRARIAELENVASEATSEVARVQSMQTEQAQVAAAYAGLFDGTSRLPVAPLPGLGASPGYGLTVRGAPTSSFASLRGQLPLPVRSGGEVRDATREDGHGLEFAVGPGSRVSAVAEGTVAFARPYGVYGSMVVLDHGQSHYTVYSGLERIDVSVGQNVRPRQELGASGSTMYFEVRHGTRSLDPHEWVGI